MRPVIAALWIVTFVGPFLAFDNARAEENKTPVPNRPDQAVDVLGEFLWARTVGPYERARFVGPEGGEPTTDWSGIRFEVAEGKALKRNNLTTLRPETGYSVQVRSLRLDTTGAHNCKIMLGYMGTDWRFTHGDNNDLAHWAGGDRVVLFVPIRHAQGADPAQPENYFISPYGGQTLSVVEFKAGELVRYEWYQGGPQKLHPRILMDLHPVGGGANDLKPGVMKPIFKFNTYPGGKWKVWIKRDGRDGVIPQRDEDWDHVFTESSPGAKPYTVDLAQPNAFSLTVYSPSGADNNASDITLGVVPFDRATGATLPVPDRTAMKKDVKLGELPGSLPPSP